MSEQIDRQIAEIARRSDLPRHVAVIMDGNGRWATKRRLPRIDGHRAGREAVRATVRTCARIGMEALSLYTFSIENWRRPRAEVTALMAFLRNVLSSEFLELDENDIRLRASGRLDMLSKDTRSVLDETIDKLSGNHGMILNLCLSYGGRAEIVDAVNRILDEMSSGERPPGPVDEREIASRLYAPELPDPDLLIRTSGEFRISNFFLWELAYTEIVVLDVLWPDFREPHLLDAIREYLGRERRYGRVGGHRKEDP